MEITKEQFQEYRDVQDSGMFNMFDPNARAVTSLSKPQWIEIIKNYDELEDKYEGGE
mgnify:CR=1 FL=1